jgi:hypothetical protein
LTVTVAAYGGGTNSTAMLIECAKRGLKVDLILFADTGGEKPHTYKYVETFSDWLVDNGMPRIISVKKAGNGETLEEDCLRNNMLPSIAYGFKSCSQKYKIQPQDMYCNNYDVTRAAWKRGEKVTKLIGYDADEQRRAKVLALDKYQLRYPLIEWWMGRDDCIETIESAGLCLPGKSACWFCPSSRPAEVRALKAQYPELAERALAMEANAKLTSIKGLGRNWSWSALLATDDLFGDEGFSEAPELSCDCFDG